MINSIIRIENKQSNNSNNRMNNSRDIKDKNRQFKASRIVNEEPTNKDTEVAG